MAAYSQNSRRWPSCSVPVILFRRWPTYSVIAILLMSAVTWFFYDQRNIFSRRNFANSPSLKWFAKETTSNAADGQSGTRWMIGARIQLGNNMSLARWLSHWTDMTYEEANKNCTSFIVGNISEHTDLPRCTKELFDAHLRSTNGFPSSGNWSQVDNKLTFHPSFCSFLRNADSADILQNCIAKAGDSPTKLLILGDSNAGHFTRGLINSLNVLGMKCKEVRREVLGPTHSRDAKYFAVKTMPEQYIKGHKSLYRGTLDYSFTTMCSMAQNATRGGKTLVQVEYISSSNLVETTLSLQKTRGPGQFRREVFATFTEYIFKHYLKAHGYPDYVAFYAPFHHVRWHSSSEQAALDILYVDSIFRIYLPQSTEIFWIPDGRECVAMQPTTIPKIIREGLSSNQRLHALNRLLFEVLKEKITDVSFKVHGFLDLGKISCPLECKWHADGAHMVQAWYDSVASYLLQITCS